MYAYGTFRYGYGDAPRYGHHTYGEISGPDGYLARIATFAGSSMHGRWTVTGEGHRVFQVFSYRTVIAEFDETTGDRWFTDQHYSRTTSRHLGLALAWLAVAVEPKAKAGELALAA